MSIWIKRSILIVCVSCMCVFSGCTTSSNYHDGSSKSWIQEQVQKGYLTQEEANELLKQESIQ